MVRISSIAPRFGFHRRWAVVLIFAALLSGFVVHLSRTERWRQQQEQPQIKTGQEKIILFWTPYYGDNPFRDVHNAPFYLENCARDFDVHCVMTTDKSHLNQSSAVIFHDWDLSFLTWWDWLWNLPPYHKESQMWVYLNGDTPFERRRQKSLAGYDFNWTMTYRWDSDIPDPYGRTVRLPSARDDEDKHRGLVEEALGKKEKLVAWVCSHCDAWSQRDKIVKDMQELIPVDVYGKCGTLECAGYRPWHWNSQCFKEIGSSYKFYLAFENSLCVDYITEKAFHPLQYYMVPIVYGGTNYSAFLPPNSFIDIFQFDTLKDLTDYLLQLDKDDAAYAKYFEWKRFYEVTEERGSGWCTLCQKISSSESEPLENKMYGDVAADFVNSRGNVKVRKAPSWMKPYLYDASGKNEDSCNLFV